MVGQDADRPHGCARGEHLDLLAEHLSLGSEHFDWELGARHGLLASAGHAAPRFELKAAFQAAFANRATPDHSFVSSSTCSIVPFRKNARSGTSSCLPSMISSKPRIVSAIGTYAPGVPVNCSATKNGWERKRSILRARWTVSLSSSESSSIPRMAMMSCSSL